MNETIHSVLDFLSQQGKTGEFVDIESALTDISQPAKQNILKEMVELGLVKTRGGVPIGGISMGGFRRPRLDQKESGSYEMPLTYSPHEAYLTSTGEKLAEVIESARAEIKKGQLTSPTKQRLKNLLGQVRALTSFVEPFLELYNNLP